MVCCYNTCLLASFQSQDSIWYAQEYQLNLSSQYSAYLYVLLIPPTTKFPRTEFMFVLHTTLHFVKYFACLTTIFYTTQLAPYDCRHSLHTLANMHRHKVLNGTSCKVHMCIYEENIEGIARHMLLLAIILDATWSTR